MKGLHLTTLIFLVIGGLNWGLVGFTQVDAVAWLFGGPQAALSRILYILVGFSALFQFLGVVQAVRAYRRPEAPAPDLAFDPRWGAKPDLRAQPR